MDYLNKFKGIFPAFYACYDTYGNVSTEKNKKFARYLVQKGIQGLYVGGSSGECIYQSLEERKQALKAVVEEVGGETVLIAHVACNNTKDSMELASYAASIGVDAIAAIPPIYFHLPEYAVAEYWNSISYAAPNTPFIIYNIPQFAGTKLTPSLLKEMKKNPNLLGVKNSSISVQDIRQFQDIGGEEFVVFNGPDEQYAAGRMMGAVAGIGGTYAVMPELFLAIDQFLMDGKFEIVQNIQADIVRIISVMYGGTSNLYAIMKEYLRQYHEIDLGGVRSPMTNYVEQDAERVKLTAQLIDCAIQNYTKH